MDFFGQQDQARRRTRRLVLLFALAVVAIVLAVYLAVAVSFAANEPGGAARFFDPALFREMGRRFLQLPIEEAQHVELAALEAAAA